MSCIAIDTCIFLHLLNPMNNQDDHIDSLLIRLAELEYLLLTDSTEKIPKEYQARIEPAFKDSSDTGTKIQILRYWMTMCHRRIADLNRQDELMRAIRCVIPEIEEHADRAFVYVAFKCETILVTNDSVHILSRREDLLARTLPCRGKNAYIYSSFEAHGAFLR